METRTFPRTYLLNIGMAVTGKPDNTRGALMIALANQGLLPVSTVYHFSQTEETAVLQFDVKPTAKQVNGLCRELSQESIAFVELPSGQGKLYGPKAKKWGPFNPGYFIMPNGAPLKQTGQGATIGAWGNGN